MLDVSLSELLLTALVAFLVVNPKDLPGVLREVSDFFKMLRRAGEEVRQGVASLTEEVMPQEQRKMLQHEVQETRRYIVDDTGNFQEVYDISEFLKETDPPHKPH